jgi:hypothetical protein
MNELWGMNILPKVSIGAVLTGDIVNSTKLFESHEEKLVNALTLFFKNYTHEFYRGDSFQVYVKQPKKALRLALVCRALAIGITGQEETEISGDVRIGIGIGEINNPVHKLGTAKGEAFLLSGRQLDALQIDLGGSDRRLAISCGDDKVNIGFQVMADYLDNIYKGMTGKQAAVIVELLSGTTQQQLTVTLNKSKSTISQLANAGRWPEIERLLHQYEELVKLIA